MSDIEMVAGVETMDQKIERLRLICKETSDKYWAASQEHNRKYSELKSKYEVLILAESKAERDALMEAQKANHKADHDWRQAVEQRNLEASLAKLPHAEGTVLCKWTMHGWSSCTYRKSTEKGIFQVFRKGDEEPSNRRYSRLSAGDFVVRPMKKDGSVGIKVEQYGGGWYAEGVDPNKKVEKIA